MKKKPTTPTWGTHTYTCCVCNVDRINESSRGDDFPYHPHALHCAGPGGGGICRCIQKVGEVCSDECDEKGLKAKDFHYPDECRGGEDHTLSCKGNH